MLEHEWKAFLATRGVAVPRGVFLPVRDDTVAVNDELRALRPPFAVKALGPAIVHKSDVGAVRLGVGGGDALAATIDDMLARLARGPAPAIAGVLVEEMAAPGIEVMVGVVSDATFGRLLAFGLGGTRVEAAGDVHFFTLPLRPPDVDTLLAIIPWLPAAARRSGEGGLRALRELVWAFGGPGGLGAHPALDALELNPVVVGADTAIALDARGTMRAC